VIAPTGTIGLVMDCDTTGIEPDFALVKFKKLVGGGYFKIINRAVPAALRVLGYSESDIAEIEAYALGHGNLGQAPAINHATLKAKGFTDEAIAKVEKALPTAFDIKFAFNKWTLGEEFLRDKLGVPAECSPRPRSTCSRTRLHQARDRGRERACLRRDDQSRARRTSSPSTIRCSTAPIRAAAPASATSRSRATSA
jgi:ribonucleotide reductase alpha subunit